MCPTVILRGPNCFGLAHKLITIKLSPVADVLVSASPHLALSLITPMSRRAARIGASGMMEWRGFSRLMKDARLDSPVKVRPQRTRRGIGRLLRARCTAAVREATGTVVSSFG